MNTYSVTLRKSTDTAIARTSRELTYPRPARYPGHREGMRMNDLETLRSLLMCNALDGQIGLMCTDGGTILLPLGC